MTREETIQILTMENDLMLFDPDTGEEKSYESLSEADQKCYSAHLAAIKAIKENQELKNKIRELEKDNKRLGTLEYLDKLQGREGQPWER